MKVYFAGVQSREANEYIRKNGLNRLLSYGYSQGLFKERYKAGYKTFLDSGAYTAWTKGEKIDVDKYIEFVNKYDDGIDWFVQVDEIPGKRGYTATPEERMRANEQTWKNFVYMHERVKSPQKLVPVFHAGSDERLLRRFLDFEPKIELIAIGNIVGKSKQEKVVKLEKVFEVIGNSNNPNVKVHALGVQDFSLAEMFPLYSADASSWVLVSGNGGIMSHYGAILVSDKSTHKKNHLFNMSKPVQEEIKQFINDYGFTVEELSKEYKKRTLFNIKWLVERAKQYKCNYGSRKKQKTLF